MNEFLQSIGALCVIVFLFSTMAAIIWSCMEVKSLQKKYDALEPLLNSLENKADFTQMELRKLLKKLEKEGEND